ncbi:hypothetical protein Tco_0552686, partial [Tanacetum coccineum]
EIDKLAELTDEMQLKQEGQGCVHASNELQLHVVHVVADEHEGNTKSVGHFQSCNKS